MDCGRGAIAHRPGRSVWQDQLGLIPGLVCVLLLGACGGGSSSSVQIGGASLTVTRGPWTPVIDYGTPLPAQIITIKAIGVPAGHRALFSTVIKSDFFGPAIWAANADDNTMVVTIPVGTALPGSHAASFQVTACLDKPDCSAGVIGQTQVLDFSLMVNGIAAGAPGFLSPEDFHFYINDSSPSADYTQQFLVYSTSPWTAVASNPALTLSETSGNGTSTTGKLVLSQAAVDHMDVSSGTSNATVTVTAGAKSVVVPVTIAISKPQMMYATPHVQPAAVAGDVLLSGYSLANTDIAHVYFGSTMATSVESNYEGSGSVVARHPPLPAGVYPVSFTNSSGAVVPRSTASLVVANPMSTTPQWLAYPDARVRKITVLHLDAEHNALVLVAEYPASGEAATEILRYSWNGTWAGPSVTVKPYLSSLAPRIDGKGWMAVALTETGMNSILMCTPEITSCTNTLTASAAGERWTQIAMTDDNEPRVMSRSPEATGAGLLYAYSIRNNTLTRYWDDVFNDGFIVASADGYKVAMGSRKLVGSPAPPVLQSTASHISNFATGINFSTVSRLSLDQKGQRLLVNAQRVTNLVSRVEEASLPLSALAGVLTPDGMRAYTYDQDGLIHAYDLSMGQKAGQYFPEMGTPIAPSGNPGAGVNGQDMQMILSLDGRTLYLAGSLGVAVQPLP